MNVKPIALVLSLFLSISAFSQEVDPLYMESSAKKDSTNQNVEYRVTGPKKSVFLAGFLSLLVPGAGQMYTGQWGSAAFYLLTNMTCNTVMKSALNTGNRDLYTIALSSGLAINLFAIINACNGASKVNFERGYRSGVNVRLQPYVDRVPDLMATSNGGINNYGLSLNVQF